MGAVDKRWTQMSASGTSRHFAAVQNLSPIGPTTDKVGFRRELAMTRVTHERHCRAKLLHCR